MVFKNIFNLGKVSFEFQSHDNFKTEVKQSLPLQSDQNHSTSFTLSESLHGQGWSSCNALRILATTAHHLHAQLAHLFDSEQWTSTLMAELTWGKIIICLHLVAVTSTFHEIFSKRTFLIDKVTHNFIIINFFFFYPHSAPPTNQIF